MPAEKPLASTEDLVLEKPLTAWWSQDGWSVTAARQPERNISSPPKTPKLQYGLFTPQLYIINVLMRIF